MNKVTLSSHLLTPQSPFTNMYMHILFSHSPHYPLTLPTHTPYSHTLPSLLPLPSHSPITPTATLTLSHHTFPPPPILTLSHHTFPHSHTVTPHLPRPHTLPSHLSLPKPRNRLPIISDDLCHWSDVIWWRQIHFKAISRSFDTNPLYDQVGTLDHPSVLAVCSVAWGEHTQDSTHWMHPHLAICDTPSHHPLESHPCPPPPPSNIPYSHLRITLPHINPHSHTSPILTPPLTPTLTHNTHPSSHHSSLPPLTPLHTTLHTTPHPSSQHLSLPPLTPHHTSPHSQSSPLLTPLHTTPPRPNPSPSLQPSQAIHHSVNGTLKFSAVARKHGLMDLALNTISTG